MPKIELNGNTYGGNIYDTQPIGEVIDSASDKNPAGYLPCDGRSVKRSDYPDLFKKIGTVYGSEDDEHFNLPSEEDIKTTSHFIKAYSTNSDVQKIIHDDETNTGSTWSSEKINDTLNGALAQALANLPIKVLHSGYMYDTPLGYNCEGYKIILLITTAGDPNDNVSGMTLIFSDVNGSYRHINMANALNSVNFDGTIYIHNYSYYRIIGIA